MKSKTKIINILLVLLVLPCMIIFSACGGGDSSKPNLDVSGTYTVTEKTAFETDVAGEQATSNQDKNIKFYAQVKSTGMDMTMSGMMNNSNLDPVGYFNINAKVTEGRKTESGSMDLYLKDGFMYMSTYNPNLNKDMKIKMDLSVAGAEEFAEDMIENVTPMEKLDISAYLDDLESLLPAGSTISVSENGSKKIYRISQTASSPLIGNSDTYIVFENGSITGIKVAMTIGSEMSTEIILMYVDEQLNFPNLDSYEEVDPSELGGMMGYL